jgi:hypothetical protein
MLFLVIALLFGIIIATIVVRVTLEALSDLFDTPIKNVLVSIVSLVVLAIIIPFLSVRLYGFFFGSGDSRDSIEERYQEALKAES